MNEPLLGTIFLFAGNFAPMGYAMCQGQLLPINQNTALFSILGTTYGGDGITTFALPKLSGPAEGTNYIIALNGIYPSRN
ncbi:tail fiber protein [uncultured Paludibaculum sp.]|uniref:phage tail protein n=1 Tax=uncultured Paludibaculum sp. TaxID=1765020 RepID=UPI002AABD0FB|nr:tail fiber protein [uncultured Paludibaculum sp.]